MDRLATRREFAVPREPLFPLLVYLGLIVVAETVAGFGETALDIYLGMTIHVVLLFTLLIHGALLLPSDEALSKVLAALSLVPLIRVLSMATPFAPFTIVEWLLVISFPLLAAAFTVMYVLDMSFEDVALRLGSVRGLPLQAGVAVSGLGLGTLEFAILRPPEPWIPALTLAYLVPAALVLGVSSGLAEELIFRGLLQSHADRMLGPLAGLLFVSVLFAAMHIGFRNALDLVFVFGVGLYFGYVVQRTRTLVGVTFAHGLANVALYLILPFYF